MKHPLAHGRKSRYGFPHDAFIACVAVLMAILSCGSSVGAPIDEVSVSEDYVVRSWELTEGLPDNHVSSLARGSDGYFWITTFSGLVRFDGERFVVVGNETFPGLPSPWVAPDLVARDHSSATTSPAPAHWHW